MLEQRLLSKLNEISNCLQENHHLSNSQGVLAGESGLVLFYFYFSKFSKEESFSDLGLNLLEKSVETINSEYNFSSFCSGVSGTAWVFNHLESKNFLEINNDEFLPDLDDFLFDEMIKDIRLGNYDFLHNALGNAYYFLSRYRDTKSKKLKKTYKSYILKFIKELENISEFDTVSVKWRVNFNIREKVSSYNLSLSHGMSSIINFLCRLHVFDDFRPQVENMLKFAIKFILSHFNEKKNTISLFPDIIKQNESIEFRTRVAWCYGDLGIGMSLWKASQTLQDLDLEKLAIESLTHTASRKTPYNTMVSDAGLCHGSFGNAQIFMYLFRQTKIVDFQKSAQFWIEDGLNKLTHKNSYAGHKKLTADGWENELSLLEGIAGIGLAIMSYLNEDFSSWDECMMIT